MIETLKAIFNGLTACQLPMNHGDSENPMEAQAKIAYSLALMARIGPILVVTMNLSSSANDLNRPLSTGSMKPNKGGTLLVMNALLGVVTFLLSEMKMNKISSTVWETDPALTGLGTMKRPVTNMKVNGIGLTATQPHLHSGVELNLTTTTVTISRKEKTACASGTVLSGTTGGVTRKQALCVRRLLHMNALLVLSLLW